MKRSTLGQVVAGAMLFVAGILFLVSGTFFGTFAVRLAFTLATWAGAAIALGKALDADPGLESRLRAAAAQMQSPAPQQPQQYQAPPQQYQAPQQPSYQAPAPAQRMCVNGHAMAAGASFCTVCGAPAR